MRRPPTRSARAAPATVPSAPAAAKANTTMPVVPSESPRESTRNSGTSASRPNCSQVRSVVTASSRLTPGTCAGARAARCSAGAGGVIAAARRSRRTKSRPATTRPGTRKTSVARSSRNGIAIAATSGPAAKPAFPPTMNQARPVAVRSPEMRFATRAASGWKAAMPRPEPTMQASTPV